MTKRKSKTSEAVLRAASDKLDTAIYRCASAIAEAEGDGSDYLKLTSGRDLEQLAKAASAALEFRRELDAPADAAGGAAADRNTVTVRFQDGGEEYAG